MQTFVQNNKMYRMHNICNETRPQLTTAPTAPKAHTAKAMVDESGARRMKNCEYIQVPAT